MTAFNLQDELAEEIEHILKDMLFKDVHGKDAKVRAYAQELPKRRQGVKAGEIMPEEDEDPYPFCVVRLDSGSLKTPQSAHEVKTILVFGICDRDFSCQGHRGILNIFQRVAERFTIDPVLNQKYRMNYEAGINWMLDEEDRYPYFYGAMEMTWDTFFVRREDPYA